MGTTVRKKITEKRSPRKGTGRQKTTDMLVSSSIGRVDPEDNLLAERVISERDRRRAANRT